MRPRTVSPLRVSASRWPTPKRCCSSTIDRPRRWNSTWSWISACVPTTSCTLPSAAAAAASRRALAVRLPLSQATFTPSGCSHDTSLRKCCSARISVGAINATCAPPAMAWAAAMAATTVLPLPTSPCSRRCIGYGRARSAEISATTRCWAPVSLNGSAWYSRSTRPPGSSRTGNTSASLTRRAARAAASDSCWASNSSNLMRRQAGCTRSSSAASDSPCAGVCSARIAGANGGRS
ncbi:Uncharacterised protein [Achromobacter xylosoxidans]|nr:Uncharacterised protein [Achromobacter xylosoxidans]